MDVFKVASIQEMWNAIQDGYDPTKHEKIQLSIGDNEFTLNNGKNILIFKGFGIIKVEYAGGAIL